MYITVYLLADKPLEERILYKIFACSGLRPEVCFTVHDPDYSKIYFKEALVQKNTKNLDNNLML